MEGPIETNGTQKKISQCNNLIEFGIFFRLNRLKVFLFQRAAELQKNSTMPIIQYQTTSSLKRNRLLTNLYLLYFKFLSSLFK